ncbi:hypothetical protein COU17_02410 [Candidatus Kaiserbacteria bacterium CG10_big_fil_rev_8_21_14_0_10_49_17]|uniref:Methionine--tRNA ligase n=1 Tax=Candidatus Kaiserbacteria bacterium CG10_big_fil_rev_8_21_14_0_10_49_17 TaxID=1974609 RepID=A0A2M6WE30_9BACT|nr:MAG: hypothetical protein COU17_02410 [Candidatus Kaiserbacteria bacterium CG10_big_fil_rev_8_21_14_0_10_49_17]
MISYDDFAKLEARIGKVVDAEKVPDTDKLLKLSVDVGEEKPRQIISGIAEHVSPEDIIGKSYPFLVNLEPRVIRGHESQGMILAVGTPEGDFALLEPHVTVPPGSSIR